MKVLLLGFMLVCLLYATEGLECRECDDDSDYSYSNSTCDQNSNKTTRCFRSENFCVTYKLDCGENAACYERDCDYLGLCKSVETREIFHPVFEEKITFNCCQGDLCNDKEEEELFISIGVSASLNSVSNVMSLFYFIISQLFP